MADVPRKSWQTKAHTAHVALYYDDMDTVRSTHNLETYNVKLNHLTMEYINDINYIKMAN